MSREEIIAALTELGIESSEAHTDDELLALLDAATSADTTVAAADETVIDEAPDALTSDDSTFGLVDVDPANVPPMPPVTPPAPEAPAKGKGRGSKPSASEYVSCRLGPGSQVGALMVGNARIEARKTGLIPRAEFERLQAEYDLVEVEQA